MAYIISEEAKDLLQDIKNFCNKEVQPKSLEVDRSGEVPHDLYAQISEMQLQTLDIPEEYGGPGLDKVSVAALLEEVAKADAGVADTIAATWLALRPVLVGGTEEQKQHCCDLLLDGGYAAFALTEPMAGSDAGSGKTTAVRDGEDYVLNGRKCFITNGDFASFYVVTAMTDKTKGAKGISAFLVEAGTPGLSFGEHEDKMGIRASGTCDVVLENCRIPAKNLLGKEGEGFSLAMQGLDGGRIWIGCIAVGLAQRAMEEAISYGKERQQFGAPILKNQAMQFKIADMDIKIETARQMVAHALILQEKGFPFSREAAIAKCYASDMAMQVTVDAVQVFGGYGYIRDYPVEKLMRDAKIYQIFEGTNEILHVVIANRVLGKM